MKEVDQIRAELKKNRSAIIGSTGGYEDALLRVCDRLDELEWIVTALRTQQKEPER